MTDEKETDIERLTRLESAFVDAVALVTEAETLAAARYEKTATAVAEILERGKAGDLRARQTLVEFTQNAALPLEKLRECQRATAISNATLVRYIRQIEPFAEAKR